MAIRYYDEPIVGRSKVPMAELQRQIQELEIKNYGHVLPKTVAKRQKRKTIYSMKKSVWYIKILVKRLGFNVAKSYP